MKEEAKRRKAEDPGKFREQIEDPVTSSQDAELDVRSPRTYRSDLEKSRNVSDRSDSPKANLESGNAVHDKAWLYTFLVQTIAYLGGTAYINYAAFSNGNQSITEDSQLGPIDLYVASVRWALIIVMR
jgi:hypothetical protein